MDKEPSLHGLGPDKLAKLWDIDSDADIDGPRADVDSEERYTELLCDWLAQPLPLDPEETQNLVSHLPPDLGELCRTIMPFSDSSIGDLLTHPETDGRLLERIKEHAKRQGNAATNELEREVAETAYLAAIAAGLALHGIRISTQSDKHLGKKFDTLSRRQAAPPQLRSLFQRACLITKSGPEAPQETGDRR